MYYYILIIKNYMKNILWIVACCFILCSCGTSKKITSNKNGLNVIGEMHISSGNSNNNRTTKTNSNSANNSNSNINTSSAEKKLGININSNDNKKLYAEVAEWIGTPYKYGGTSKSGVDCSGFVYSVYKAVYGKTLTRQSAGMLTNDCNKISKNELREGDLLFFRTDGKKSSTPNHVAIYLKDNKFAHASSSKGVVVNDLSESYYVKTWLTGGRVK